MRKKLFKKFQLKGIRVRPTYFLNNLIKKVCFSKIAKSMIYFIVKESVLLHLPEFDLFQS